MLDRRPRQPQHPAPRADGAQPADDSPVVVIDDETFMDQTAGRVTIVDFWAPWCGPCLAFAPIFEAAAAKHSGTIAFGKCNVDENPKTSALLQILSIPTLVVFGRDGSELGRIVGAVPRRQLDAIIQQATAAARV